MFPYSIYLPSLGHQLPTPLSVQSSSLYLQDKNNTVVITTTSQLDVKTSQGDIQHANVRHRLQHGHTPDAGIYAHEHRTILNNSTTKPYLHYSQKICLTRNVTKSLKDDLNFCFVYMFFVCHKYTYLTIITTSISFQKNNFHLYQEVTTKAVQRLRGYRCPKSQRSPMNRVLLSW